MHRVPFVLPCLLGSLLAPFLLAQQPPEWSNWRGPAGNGTAPAAKPPLRWNEQEGLRWKAPLPGSGCSSPVVCGDRIFVTTAIATDRDGAPAAGNEAEKPPAETPPSTPPGEGPRGQRQGRPGRGAAPPSKVHEFVVLAYDSRDGKEVWRTVVNECVPHEGAHPTGSLASGSPITDGERIYAFFGSRGLHCLGLAGKLLWSLDLGRQRVRGQFGEGASPALHGDVLVVPWDHEGASFVAAFDKRTKKELWRQSRPEKSNWATPLVVEVGGKPQVILTGTQASRGYDLRTGEVVWSHGGMTENCIPTPIHDQGVVYLMSGFRGACLQAIRLAGAVGDLTGSKQVLWSHDRETSYTPSGLLHGGLFYFLKGNNGSLSCLDAATGAVHYEGQKVDGLRTVYSSPVAAGGRIYITSREGTTKVIAPGPKYEELATNQLDDTFDATMALVGDVIYLRGRKNLYCIGAAE